MILVRVGSYVYNMAMIESIYVDGCKVVVVPTNSEEAYSSEYGTEGEAQKAFESIFEQLAECEGVQGAAV